VKAQDLQCQKLSASSIQEVLAHKKIECKYLKEQSKFTQEEMDKLMDRGRIIAEKSCLKQQICHNLQNNLRDRQESISCILKEIRILVETHVDLGGENLVMNFG